MLGSSFTALPLRGFVQRVQEWPVASQQQARRNAMIASTACAQRRAEREDVADYLSSLAATALPTEQAERPQSQTSEHRPRRTSHG